MSMIAGNLNCIKYFALIFFLNICIFSVKAFFLLSADSVLRAVFIWCKEVVRGNMLHITGLLRTQVKIEKLCIRQLCSDR